MKKALLLAPMSSVHERFNVTNIKALKDLGYEIHLAANFSLCEHDINYKDEMLKDGIVIHDISFSRGSLLKNLKTIPQIKELLKKEKFDIVHCHTETGGILTRLSESADKNAKYIYTPHGMSFYKGSSLKSQLIYRPIEKWICSKMNANLAMNSEELEVLKNWNPDTAKFVHGVGLDTDIIKHIDIDTNQKRRELGIPEDAQMVLSIGELNDNKNHQVVIKALSELKNDNVYYLICGEGEKRQYLTDLAAENSFADRLILTGYRYDVKEILKTADLFVFPSFHEGLPVSVMEAMAAGLPVICSEIRGNVDLIKTGEGGILCNPESVEDFKNAIEKLLTDKNSASEMGIFNLKNIEKFSLNEVKDEIEKIYKESAVK